MATTKTQITSETIESLRATVELMDSLSHSGFSEIGAIAKLALSAMETPGRCEDFETIALAFQIILDKAEDMQNFVNSEAGAVGCNYEDKQSARRRVASRVAAQERTPRRMTD